MGLVIECPLAENAGKCVCVSVCVCVCLLVLFLFTFITLLQSRIFIASGAPLEQVNIYVYITRQIFLYLHRNTDAVFQTITHLRAPKQVYARIRRC